MKSHIPQKGDFIIITLDMQSGHEQKGYRHALVVSNSLFNEQTGHAIVCPITTADRGYPFHVAVTGIPDMEGFVMVEQVRSIDIQAHQIKVIRKASNELLDEVLAILDACIY